VAYFFYLPNYCHDFVMWRMNAGIVEQQERLLLGNKTNAFSADTNYQQVTLAKRGHDAVWMRVRIPQPYHCEF
jgi:hypothetical protein